MKIRNTIIETALWLILIGVIVFAGYLIIATCYLIYGLL